MLRTFPGVAGQGLMPSILHAFDFGGLRALFDDWMWERDDGLVNFLNHGITAFLAAKVCAR